MDYLVMLALLPMMIPYYIASTLYRDFLHKDFPIDGIGLVLIGVPLGVVCWVVILYECACHIHVSVS